MLKRGINGTHIHVSAKHLPKYLGEFEYRWNMRAVPHLMLDRLMHSFARVSPSPPLVEAVRAGPMGGPAMLGSLFGLFRRSDHGVQHFAQL
jgi:hypothetical protein